MRIDRIEDLKEEILESDVVASETLRWALKQDKYKDTTKEEIKYLLEWSGDDEYVGADDIVEKNTWIIGKCGTEWDGVDLERVYGTKEQVKKYLADCVLRDKGIFEDSYDYGTESVDKVEERSNGNLYAYGVYYSTHIDYEATIEKTPRNLDYLTWDDLYERAIGAACGSGVLKAKDEARYQVREMVLERTGYDIETAEIPEEEVEEYCDKYNIMFDEHGNIIK